jgi:peptide/nickel transport system ATP-binding protein
MTAATRGDLATGQLAEPGGGPVSGLLPLRSPLLEVSDLKVGFGPRRTRRAVVRGVSFAVRAGECLAIVGESGSGKSVTARTLVGLTGGGSHVEAERLDFNGTSLLGLSDRQWRKLRGAGTGFILQDALVSLDRLRLVGQEIAEPLRLHRWGTRPARQRKVIELLKQVGVPEPEVRARQRPSELSGGLRQRALIASAIALGPSLIVADEPTTALDVTVQAQILGLLEQMKKQGMALILISHDLAVVARLADHVAVMADGVFVEQGPARQVLARPQADYTQALLDALPSAHAKGTSLSPARKAERPARLGHARLGPAPAGPPVLRAVGLVKRYRGPDGKTRTVVDDVSFELPAGQTLGVVGESGSGKTTTARMVMALTAPDEGQVLLDGEPWTAVPEKQRRQRRRLITAIYQDPLSSFDPRWSVEHIIADSLDGGQYPGRDARRQRVGELLALVGLSDEHRERRPLQLSGGQRQRVAVARALGPGPSVIVCDEPVSSLDASIQAQVLDLLSDLQAELAVSYLFISHDLGVVHHMSDRVVVMKDGRIVESGTADEIFNYPSEPYTRQLIDSLPSLDVA